VAGPIPVTTGSAHSATLDLGALRMTDARFPPNLVLERHAHDRVVFVVAVEGMFEDRVGGREYSLAPASVLIEPLGQPHENFFRKSGARVVIVQPDPAQDEMFEPCRQLFAEPRHFRDAGIVFAAHRALRELDQPDAITPLAVEAAALEMLAIAARVRLYDQASALPTWLARAHELIHECYLDQLRVGQIAAESGVHPVHLARVFRARFHCDVAAYVRRLRLEWAARALSSDDLSLAAVAARAGFSDQSHFTRCFKRYTGMTPGQFRSARPGQRRDVANVPGADATSKTRGVSDR
jgi:AraC family transcriptional regulator